MKKIKTNYLKIALGAILLFILFLELLVTFNLLSTFFKQELYWQKILTYLGLYSAGILGILVVAWVYRILRLIDQDNPFSQQALKLVMGIKNMMLGIFLALSITLPMFYHIADVEDAPGVVLIGLGLAAIPLAGVTFVATVEKLLERVIHMKLENDLTV
jgi:hypothetical protein